VGKSFFKGHFLTAKWWKNPEIKRGGIDEKVNRT
jgi:hypothetical protein